MCLVRPGEGQGVGALRASVPLPPASQENIQELLRSTLRSLLKSSKHFWVRPCYF